MNKKKLLSQIKLNHLNIEVDCLTKQPFSIGCYLNDGMWLVYRIGEKQDIHILNEFLIEEDAYDYLYQLVKFEERMSS